MKLIFITLFYYLRIFQFIAETKIFKIGFIDLKNDIRYSDWGRHPVDIRSKNSKQQRPLMGLD